MQNAVDGQSGESFLVQPMALSANSRPSADTLRPPVTVIGIYVAPQIEYARRPHDRIEGRNRDFSATRPTVKIQAVLVPYALAAGDRVTRLATGERYEIAAPGADGFGRLLLPLTARGKASP